VEAEFEEGEGVELVVERVRGSGGEGRCDARELEMG
jgi:hypothetical protein